MEEKKTKTMPRMILRFVCVWILACAWIGCASKGGVKEGENLSESRASQGPEGRADEMNSESSADSSKGDETGPSAVPFSPWDPSLNAGYSGNRMNTQSPFSSDYFFSSGEGGAFGEVPSEGRIVPSFWAEENSRIDAFVTYFAGESRSRFQQSLAQSARYLPAMRRIFREEGVPEDLVYIAHVESGFNPWLSAGQNQCVGMWQFLEGTGRKYGLRIDGWVDERRDPEKSARAAARYLKDLYSAFQSWELAIAAYNAGEGNISSYLVRRNASNFWELCQHSDLRQTTKDFVPKFLAARKIFKNPEAYGFDHVPYQEPWQFDRVRLSGQLNMDTIARLAESSSEEIRALNPQLKGAVSPPDRGETEIRVPAGKGEDFQLKLAQGVTQYQQPHRASRETNESSKVRVHHVKAGETLAGIAGCYKVQVDAIQKLNNISSATRLREGTDLKIPRAEGLAEKENRLGKKETTTPGAATENHASKKDGKVQSKTIVHEVKKGESLWAISRKYGIPVSDISRWNGLKGNELQPGARLTLLR
jgi:membrane-bound lytic murein transglycosylase D